MLAVLEFCVMVAAVYVAVLLRFGGIDVDGEVSIEPLWPRAVAFAVIGLMCMTAVGLYNPRLRDALEGVAVRASIAMVLIAAAAALLFYTVPVLFLGRGVLFIAIAITFVALLAVRMLWVRVMRSGRNYRRVAVLGAGRRAGHLLRFRRRTDFIGTHIVGYVPCPGDQIEIPEARQIHPEGKLLPFLRSHGIDELVVAADDRRGGLDIAHLVECRTSGVQVTEIVSFLEKELGIIHLSVVEPSWIVFSPGFNKRMLRLWLKRLFDIGVSTLVLVLTSPIMLLTALAIWLESGGKGPILYRQQRVGAEGIPFNVFKFRSMRVDAEQAGVAQWAQKRDPRVTRVGAFIRKYRIDELPQLFNVLQGTMSFVGPRPERPEFVGDLERAIPYYSERHRVKPGLTGWAQIRYPYGASKEDASEKLQYDLYYAKNHNLVFDLTILLMTAEVVLWGKGAR